MNKKYRYLFFTMVFVIPFIIFIFKKDWEDWYEIVVVTLGFSIGFFIADIVDIIKKE